MRVKTSCDTCLHSEVCGAKNCMEEVAEKIDESGAFGVHPYINIEVTCTKWLSSEYAKKM